MQPKWMGLCCCLTREGAVRKPAAGLVPGSSSVVGCSGEPASAGQACHNRSGLRPSAGVQREWGRAAGLRAGPCVRSEGWEVETTL